MAASTVQAKSVNNGVNTSVQDAYKNDAIDDLKMEYKMKYERLVKLNQNSMEAFANVNDSVEIHQKAYQSYVKELKNTGFEKDMKIYNLEGELANLGALYAELQNKCCELEARLKKSEAVQTNHGQVSNSQRKSPGSCGFALAKEAPVFETPIVLSSVPAIEIASPLLLPQTPCKVSREIRFSIINEALDKATPTDDKEKHAFLRGVITEQKELLDFYATLTGFAAWKEKLDSTANDSQCSIDFFKMKPQRNDLQDMELQFLVDYDVDDIEYRPFKIPSQIEESFENAAPYMKGNLYFSSDSAPKLLKTILDVIET